MPPDVSVLRVKLSRKRRGMCAATHLITCLCVVPFNCIPYSDWVKFLIHARKNHRVILPFIQGMEEAVASGLPRVVVTGGEPAMHDLGPLTEALKGAGLATHLETSGTHPVSGHWDWVTLSPKKFKPCLETWYALADELKVVVVNSHDLAWAEEHASQLKPGALQFLQPEWDRRHEVMERVLNRIQEAPQWRLSIQTHKVIGLP